MVLQEALKLIHSGEFEEALDIIDDNLDEFEPWSSDFIFAYILKSRIYYHKGRLDEAEYHIRKILEKREDIGIDDVILLQLFALQSIYQFGLGNYIAAGNSLNYLEDHIEILEAPTETEAIKTLSHYHYSKGLFLEYEGHITEAIDHFEKSKELKEALDDHFELNFVIYKIGTMYRLQGRIDLAKKYLLKSLELSENLNLVQEIATSATLLGQDLLMEMKYNKAEDYISKGLDNWKKVNSPFGILWALGELAILTYLQGDVHKAIDHYDELYQNSIDIVPALYLSNHLLNLIRFSLEIGDTERLEKYIQELEVLAKEGDEIVNSRYQLALGLINSKHHRMATRIKSMDIFEKLADHSNYLIKLDALINHSKLLVFEYKITENQVAKQEILDEAENKIEEILEFIRTKSNITYELHAAMLRSEIELLKFNPSKAKEIIEDVLDLQEVENFKTLESKFSELESDINEISNEWLGHTKFDFTKELHSIPKLKILLYLLPRHKVPFVELQEGAQLSSGNLSGQCEKLLKMDYIYKEKIFVDNKPTTVFELTPHGYLSFKKYIQELTNYLDKHFT